MIYFFDLGLFPDNYLCLADFAADINLGTLILDLYTILSTGLSSSSFLSTVQEWALFIAS